MKKKLGVGPYDTEKKKWDFPKTHARATQNGVVVIFVFKPSIDTTDFCKLPWENGFYFTYLADLVKSLKLPTK